MGGYQTVPIEDYVGKIGKGEIDRSLEHLGIIDQGMILMRKIWERELRAFAEGQPTKRWVEPEHLPGMGGRVEELSVTG